MPAATDRRPTACSGRHCAPPLIWALGNFGTATNDDLNSDTSVSQHGHQRVDAEPVDLPSHKVADPRLGHARQGGGLRLGNRFQLALSGFLKVAFHGSRVTPDAGLILVRELAERLGLEALICEHLKDSRQGLNTQFTLPDLFPRWVYSRLAGSEDLNDGDRFTADPTFALIGSPKIWDRGAALTSTLHRFETELLSREENLLGRWPRTAGCLRRPNSRRAPTGLCST